jgi:hypothetical protein
MSDVIPRIWFPEPSLADPTFAMRRETVVSWIRRSTVTRAVAVRAMLNQNLACLPTDFQKSLVLRLEREWESAYFELVVARALQQLGAHLTVEQPTSTGRQPDFLAQFLDRSVTVEAVSPVIDADIKTDDARTAPLLNEIEKAAPEGWWVVVGELPMIGLSEPRRWFRGLVRRLLDVPPPELDAHPITLIEQTQSGSLRLSLWPRVDGGRGIGAEHMRVGLDDTQARIRSVLGRKRRQVRDAKTPVLLAINASGISSSLEGFDLALFGDEAGRVYGEFNRLATDGKPPTYSGVLAFRCEGLYPYDPVLYVHPRIVDMLPAELFSMEVRRIGIAPQRVQLEPGTRSDLLQCFRLSLAT